jgi:hypothetical protein
MTLETLQAYNPISNVFVGMLQLSGVDDFVTKFQTFAPYISAEIVSYYYDNSCSCKSQIVLYTELYRNTSIEFLYNYATENNIGELFDSIMVNSLAPIVSLTGKVASTTIDKWGDFAARVANAEFKTFSTTISGDKVLVFFV